MKKKKILIKFFIYLGILLLLALLIPVGERYVELQPTITKLFILYFLLVLIGQFIHLGHTVINKYLYPKEKSLTPLTTEQKIYKIAYAIWIIVGVLLILTVIMGHIKFIPLLILYIIAYLILGIALWFNEK